MFLVFYKNQNLIYGFSLVFFVVVVIVVFLLQSAFFFRNVDVETCVQAKLGTRF